MKNIKLIRKEDYIYLRSWNIEKREVVLVMREGRKYVNFGDVLEFFTLITVGNKVYDNAKTQIFAPRRS